MTKTEREQKLIERFNLMKSFDIEASGGAEFFGGVDEVGRGPLAGPVVTACVVLPKDFEILGIDDSKKLSEKKREELYALIISGCIAYGIGSVSSEVIDVINILEATKRAMKEAIDAADTSLKSKGCLGLQHVLIDAVKLEGLSVEQTSVVKGDATSLSIAAASIVAKVTRDRLMTEYSKEYPHYAFERNKGYGTAAHYAGINEHGICPIHRRSFLKNIL